MKRILIILLALVVTMTAFIGCGNKETEIQDTSAVSEAVEEDDAGGSPYLAL